MPRFPIASKTTETLSARVFSGLVQKAKAREAAGHQVYWLTVGDTYLEPPAVARAEAQRTADHPRLHNYAVPAGDPALLDAIGDKLSKQAGREIDRVLIQVQSGATAGLSVVVKALLDAGDEVLLPSPYWPLIRGIIAGRGATPVEVPLWDRIDDESFDLEAVLEAALTPRTAAIYVNSPHNPTSRVLSEHHLEAVERVAERHDLWVLCDEAYEELWFGDEAFAPVWNRPKLRDRAVATHTLSKGYGLAGARIGYTHGPAAAMEAVRGAQTFMTYCAARPMQLGAAAAIRDDGGWADEARRLYREAGKKAAAAIGVPEPVGGTFLFFDSTPFRNEGETTLDFLARCLDAGVLMTPGRACGTAYDAFVRVCFTSLPPAALDEALGRLQSVLHR
ncbi:MAG: pyridoxal phosphate-dependent aminotransferase [Deltaproteobacteria bacterium]|nr:MAG: pyridoxal phosphate-dependent aminotransferase [Deltaproteobacteria bacterium]